MSSGFVSAGTNDEPISQDDDWLRAQQEVEANFHRKQQEGKQTGGKSLFEVLQQNKAAKQEAFEEAARLKNQFRTLDDDEVEFLDSVLESTRAKEAAVKKETAEQLEIFRKQREEAEKAVLDQVTNTSAHHTGPASVTEQESWTTSGKKRRRVKDKDTPVGLKLRKTSSGQGHDPDKKQMQISQQRRSNLQIDSAEATEVSSVAAKSTSRTQSLSGDKSSSNAPATSKAPEIHNTGGLGLAAYSSDED